MSAKVSSDLENQESSRKEGTLKFPLHLLVEMQVTAIPQDLTPNLDEIRARGAMAVFETLEMDHHCKLVDLCAGVTSSVVTVSMVDKGKLPKTYDLQTRPASIKELLRRFPDRKIDTIIKLRLTGIGDMDELNERADSLIVDPRGEEAFMFLSNAVYTVVDHDAEHVMVRVQADLEE